MHCNVKYQSIFGFLCTNLIDPMIAAQFDLKESLFEIEMFSALGLWMEPFSVYPTAFVNMLYNENNFITWCFVFIQRRCQPAQIQPDQTEFILSSWNDKLFNLHWKWLSIYENLRPLCVLVFGRRRLFLTTHLNIWNYLR